jgi:hypothetical protein
MAGVPTRPILLTSAVVIVAGMVLVAWQHVLRPSASQQAVAATSQKAEPRALSPAEESYAASLWEIHRDVTPSAVAMSFAGIAYETENHNALLLQQRIEPVAKFFGEAEPRVRGLTVPPSLAAVHSEYVEAIVLYRKASNEMLEFVKDGERRHLIDAQGMGITASEDTSCAPAKCSGRDSTNRTS